MVLLDKQKLLSSHQSQESGRITQKVYSSFWEEHKQNQDRLPLILFAFSQNLRTPRL